MRTLLLFRGAPGCGKTTYIEKNGLKPWTLSPDDLRRLYRSPDMSPDGTLVTPQLGKLEKKVWAALFDMLKERMEHGEFTVIDATNSKTEEMTRYKKLATEYRYRVFCVDMTGLPVDECKRRNASRDSTRVVPEEAIDKMYARFATQKIPSGIKVVDPEERLMDAIGVKRLDFSKWRKIVHIGDIHGCMTPLRAYFEEHPYSEDALYVFLGDYLDRGAENLETLRFLMEFSKRENVMLLEGNHERHLRDYSEGRRSVSPEFENQTRKDLDEAWTGIDDPRERAAAKDAFLSEVRQFCRRFGQLAWYAYGGKWVFCSHGGIPHMPETNLVLVPTRTLIHGAGTYGDEGDVAIAWNGSGDGFQLFGHRNAMPDSENGKYPIRLGKAFFLEGSVEFGGELRVAELSQEGWKTYAYGNSVVRRTETVAADIRDMSVGDAVKMLRANPFVREKRFGDVSSFNFSKEAFRKGVWDAQTITARGLYVDTAKMEITLRGYRKFWNVGEMPETTEDGLRRLLKFPVSAYAKENGFLVLASVHDGKLIVSTKSALDGPYAAHARKMLEPCAEGMIKNLEGRTLLLECVDPGFDPHIIKYDEAKCVVLDAVENALEFRKLPYGEVVSLAMELGLPVKRKVFEFAEWKELAERMKKVMSKEDPSVEGYVLEDMDGYMTKLKLPYYKKWKMLRSVADSVLAKGYAPMAGMLADAESNMFYGWLREKAQGLPKSERHALSGKIIELREKFLASEVGKAFR